MNDHDLIREVLKGDQIAIQELHNRYVDYIFLYIFMQTYNHYDGKEIMFEELDIDLSNYQEPDGE